MDLGTLMGLVTLVFLVVFLGIVAWAYSSRRRSDFDEAAR
ncbi:CcoQ/FixQ family Cbb3-type cytochrome c oxidase assembly chaperone, partial [Enterococcus hirae]